MNKNKTVKVGPVTLALGLVAAGLALLVYNFGGLKSVEFLWRLWPLLVIGVGVEYFVKKATLKDKDKEVHFHIPSLILIALIIFTGGIAHAVSGVGQQFNRFLDSGFWDTMENSYEKSWQGESLAVSNETVLEIEHDVGRVRLQPSGDQKLYFDAVFSSPDTPEARARVDSMALEIKQDGGTVRVTAPEYRFSGGKMLKTALDIKIPAGVLVQVNSRVGRVEAAGLKGRVKVSTGVGSVHLTKIGGDIEAQSHTGMIEVSDPGGDAEVKTDIGSINFKSEEFLDQKYRLSSNTGGIYMSLPASSDLILDARVQAGSVHVGGNLGDVPGSIGSRSAHIKLGQGTGMADLSVKTGQLNISIREEQTTTRREV